MRDLGESDAQALVREIDEELEAAIDKVTMARFVTVQVPVDGGGAEMRMICHTADHTGELVPASR